MLGAQEDLLTSSVSLITLPLSMMLEKLSRVLEIYSQKWKLGNGKGSFLDLFNRTDNNQISIQLYDERGDFPFSIARVPYLRSNILKLFVLHMDLRS